MIKKIRKYFIPLAVVLAPLQGHVADQPTQTNSEDVAIIEAYFANFQNLAKSEKWEQIVSEAVIAMEAAKRADRPEDEAKICAQLTLTFFYLGDYTQSFLYADHCRELSEKLTDPSLHIRALYLESAVYRIFASKSDQELVQQASYLRAVKLCEEANLIYSEKNVDNTNLQGKIYLNLGAAYADNPKGDLEAAVDWYSKAIACFKQVQATDDIIRTNIRLGKVYLLQKNYDLCQEIIDEVRPLVSNKRLEVHVDYLEAQLKAATHDTENAIQIARAGLALAQDLKAKEDTLRLKSLLQALENL